LFKDYKPELERKMVNGQIADIFLMNNKIAIELQCSNISLSEFEKRNKGYKEMSIPVLWIFGTQKYLRADIDKYGYSNHFRLSIVEREYLDITNNLGICYLSNGSKMELKRIIFDKWYGMATRYDSFAEFVFNKIEDFIITDDNLFMYPTTKKIDETITKHDETITKQNESLNESLQEIIEGQNTSSITVVYKTKNRFGKRYNYSTYPATEKQIKYLKKLGHNEPEFLTKKEASEWISFFKRENQTKDLFFNQKGGTNQICPVCKNHHHNLNTSFCSSKCFDIQIFNFKWNKMKEVNY